MTLQRSFTVGSKIARTLAFTVLAMSVFAQTQASAQASPNYTAEGFDQARKTKIYDFKVEGSVEGDTTRYTAQFKSPTGELLIEERAVLKGNAVEKVVIDQNQMKVKAVITFDGKVAKFSKTEGDKTKTSDETVKGDFVASANFQRYVASKWSDLSAGKTVSFRYAVWDRMETVGFQLTKIKDEGEVTVLKMKPSSFIIAALVNPIEFKFSADGARMLEMNGRLQPKLQDGSKWKDQDGIVVYKY